MCAAGLFFCVRRPAAVCVMAYTRNVVICRSCTNSNYVTNICRLIGLSGNYYFCYMTPLYNNNRPVYNVVTWGMYRHKYSNINAAYIFLTCDMSATVRCCTSIGPNYTNENSTLAATAEITFLRHICRRTPAARRAQYS